MAVQYDLKSYSSLPSTNDLAKALAKKNAPAWTAVLAARQTRGKGRRTNSWHSPSGGMYLSVILHPKSSKHLQLLTFAAALCVTKAIRKRYGIQTSIKWPNDILLDGRKVCGILTETMFAQRITAIVGIGLNLNQRDFPKEISGRATSLFLTTGRKEDARGFASLILESFIPYYAHFEKGDHKKILDEWKKNCSTLGKNITIIEQSRTFSAKAVGVNSEGMLRVRTKGGKMRTLLDAQISVR